MNLGRGWHLKAICCHAAAFRRWIMTQMITESRQAQLAKEFEAQVARLQAEAEKAKAMARAIVRQAVESQSSQQPAAR
jgi:hypothetical protein